MSESSVIIRDLLYFDESKASSLLSQLEGGLVAEIELSSQHTKGSRATGGAQTPILSFQGEVDSSDVSGSREKRIPHHAMLSRLEASLMEKQLVIDVNGELQPSTLEDGSAHRAIAKRSYLKVTGWASLEDFQRIKFIVERYQSLVEFIATCAADVTEHEPRIYALRRKIEAAVRETENTTNRKKIIEIQKEITALERQLRNTIVSSSDLTDVTPDWLLNGIDEYIDTFITNRINLAIYPFEDNPAFHVIANLKRNAFTDGSIENAIYAYGTRPNIRLSALGLITSVPQLEDKRIHPTTQYAEFGDDIPHEAGMESAFRMFFEALEGLEALVSFSRFPNVTIFPIAVYREISSPTLDSSSASRMQPNGRQHLLRRLIRRNDGT